MGRGRSVALAAMTAIASAAIPQAAGARPARPLLANRCFTLASGGRHVSASPAGGYRAAARTRRRALRFYLKPTGLETYLLYDAGARLMSVARGGAVARGQTSGPSAEWRALRRRRTSVTLRSTASRRTLAVEHGTRALVTSAGRGSRFRVRRARGCRRYPEASLSATGRPLRGKRRGRAL